MTAGEPGVEDLRRRAFAIAYRMLGSVGEAEDIVQEALLRLNDAKRAGEPIESPRAWIGTVVTRLAIDELRSARVRRELYVGEWLPEPILADAADDPAVHAETADSLSLAFLVLLERLTPEQRAVFLLREVFDYPYEEIARVIGKNEDNVRQIAVRSRRRIDEGRPRFEASRERRDALADGFFAAIGAGDLAALERLLADDVELHGDGGGKVPALARSLVGRGRVARTLRAWASAGERAGGITAERVEINGQPGALTRDLGGRLISAIALDIGADGITAVRSIINPEKLGHLGEIADVAAWLPGQERG